MLEKNVFENQIMFKNLINPLEYNLWFKMVYAINKINITPFGCH